MARRIRMPLGASILAVFLIVAAVSWAANTVTIQAGFTPNKLGAATNLSTKTVVDTNGGTPEPVNRILAYGPAGLRVNVKGLGICEVGKLEQDGPSGCPANSRVGFGGGTGLVQLGASTVKEPYTLDLFLGPTEHGRLVILVYLRAVNPVSAQLVMVGREIQGPKPYGFGLMLEVPPIHTVPGEPNASLESTFLTMGARGVAYYKTVHGRRQLFHVTGVSVPKKCPRGGFPFEVSIGFEDASTVTSKYTAACPGR